MIPPKLLSRLACPATLQPVALATADEVARLNAAVARGDLRNAAGQAVTRPLDGALIRADRRLAYAIRQGIPILLVPEGLPLPAAAPSS